MCLEHEQSYQMRNSKVHKGFKQKAQIKRAL